MSRFLLAAACGLALAAPAPADDVKPAPKRADKVERTLDALAQDFALKDGTSVSEIPLADLLQEVSKRHQVTFTILEEHFKAEGQPNIKEEKPRFAAAQISGVTVHQFLTMTLESVGATYLVKNGVIEIVPASYAARVTKTALSPDDERRLAEPLVSVIVKEKPLNEVVAQVAEMYDLTVVVAPQAADARTGFVTARVLNTPADKALELIALQADLRVVRRGAAYLITSRDHANELFGEVLDKERQVIEVQKLREAPAKPPEKPAPEAPPPAPPAPKP